MKILGIETATQICSAAIIEDDILLADYRLNIKNIHAQGLFRIIDHLCLMTNTEINKLDGIAISIGPGSFTGLRIGLAAVKGLAISSDIPVTSVSTLQGLAFQAPITNGLICPLLKSRNKEYYAALYDRQNGQDQLIKKVTVITNDELLSFLQPRTLLIGHTTDFSEIDFSDKGITIAPDHFSVPGAFNIAYLGSQQIKQNNISNIDTLEPLYHQEFIAGIPKPPLIVNKND
ncbi:tRNA (adenosine(37)-N6)-threonylcarbamoyltransferase complex dimerization subunit type 1 TsaB [candidate division KSB1 bacterium]|nr:tRNA (adenosine(37)-N6)-threonylcarbamoyltransferase complex dimerization subunit type 1 TsaB [candidate division KSB1 bacterium]